ncbi:fimbrial protein [Pantoea ananatis]|uniref:fimbrial protein n=1 Tax=Pantoea ananas TaxID=553 RepID=UPI001EE5E4EA|nr:fimbrial protein [Pantoea ananatis]MCK0553241.1 type 1 fimbrial protein [Pantoea ananatis]MDI6539730.1 fimbrial protein [Pantoea ananatis]PKC45545.1 fimbrial protein [Pantoea ananatis BRT98]
MFKKTLVAGIVAISALSATSVLAAQQNSIRFKGSVSAQTCNISVNNSTSAEPVILLETAKVSDLAAAGNTSTPTKFSIKLTGCADPGTAGQDIQVHFVSNNVDASGNLKNISTDDKPANNVSIQLLDPDNKVINLSTGEAFAKAFKLNSGETGGEAQYTAQYIATGAATAGNVEASVQYAINYL